LDVYCNPLNEWMHEVNGEMNNFNLHNFIYFLLLVDEWFNFSSIIGHYSFTLSCWFPNPVFMDDQIQFGFLCDDYHHNLSSNFIKHPMTGQH
jgi:hypothetical protein